MIQEGTYQFLGVFDALAMIIWTIILFVIVSATYNKNKNSSHYRYYRLGFYAKFFAAIAFSIIYIYKYDGGDTAAYWDTAQKFNFGQLTFKEFDEEKKGLVPDTKWKKNVIGKQRHGPTGIINLEFESAYTKFKDANNIKFDN